VLVGVVGVVLLRHVVAEEDIRQGLESVCIAPRDVESHRVLVADVLGEDFIGLEIEHDHPGGPLDAGKEIVLAPLVEVQAADHSSPREREVGLPGLLRQPTLPPELEKPAPFVLEAAQRDPPDPVDHTGALLTPCLRTKSLTA
jgi:hypothetical protein